MLAELELYGPMVAPGGYVVVFDSVMTMVHDAPNGNPAWTDDNPAGRGRRLPRGPPRVLPGPGLRAPEVTYCRGGYPPPVMSGTQCVILAGGLGTRISEESHLRPKPMIEIGGRPILWHIMKLTRTTASTTSSSASATGAT